LPYLNCIEFIIKYHSSIHILPEWGERVVLNYGYMVYCCGMAQISLTMESGFHIFDMIHNSYQNL